MISAPRIIAIVEHQADAHDLALSTKLIDLGIDSLEFVEMMLDIENESGVKIPDAAWANLNTIGDIACWLESQPVAQ
jgi:acyl carrier protein